LDDHVDVVGHGDGFGIDVDMQNLDAEQLAALIKCLPEYKPGMKIRLICCWSGKIKKDGLAAQLSHILNTEVLAPSGVVYLDSALTVLDDVFPYMMSFSFVRGRARWIRFLPDFSIEEVLR